ncbi:putative ribonuclease H-like domain-containing protein [Tanacetum coccineum]
MVPREVPMKSGLVSLNTARQVNTAHPKVIMNSARPMTNLSKSAHSTVKWPIHKNTTFKNSNFNQRVNTVKDKKFNPARPKAVVNVVKGNNVNAVKASACWVWKPKTKVLDHGNLQIDLQDKGVIDSRCSRHMTGNMSYLTDYAEIDGGYVSFGANPKAGKITRKVVIDDYNRFSWVFFLATKDETSGILKSLITRVENLIDQRVKAIRCGNRTGFKNKEMNQFCERKGIKREFSVARTPQQNGVAERKNRTLIEAARTMLADSKLPTTFWAEVVNTACYVQNKVLVIKPHNKTPYELFLGRKPALSFMRPFGCPVTILNTIDHLGKFDGKADEGFFVGYSINSKAFRVFNSRTRIVEENLHVQFSENTPNIAGSGPNWLFDIDALTKSLNYKPVVARNQSNGNTDSKSSPDARFKPSSDGEKKVDGDPSKEDERDDQEKNDNVNSTNNVNIVSDGNNTNNVNVVSSTVNTAGIEVNAIGAKTSIELPDDPNMPALEDIVYSDDDEDVGAEADMNNFNAFMPVIPIPTTRIHKDHPVEQIIRDLNSAPQTRRMTKNLEEHGLFSSVQQRTNHKDFQNYIFACFLSQEEPKKVIHALKDPSWIEAMLDELLQFKLQKIWTLVDLPNGKRPIGIKWVYRNKKDERGIVIKNKAILVAQGIEAIRLLLAYASFKDFVMYQMDVKSAFLYEKALYGLHQAPRAWYETLSNYLLDNGFQRGKIDKTLFIRRDKSDILLVQVYVDDIIFSSTKKSLCTEFEKMMHKKFQMSSMGELTFFLGLQTASIPMETQKPLLKDEDGKEVDCKKQTVVANSTTEAEYVDASSYYSQVLWIQNQFLNYRDSNEKKLIQMIKIHTDKNVADLLTKAFDKGIEVNASDSKLMLLGINLLLLGKVNAARHNLLLLVYPKGKNGEDGVDSWRGSKGRVVGEGGVSEKNEEWREQTDTGVRTSVEWWGCFDVWLVGRKIHLGAGKKS